MSSKLIVAFMLAFLVASILSGIMEGGGGVNATSLTTAVTDAGVTLTVNDTSGFLNADYVVVGTERIRYTGKTATMFTGCTRGYDDTIASAHEAGSKVYSPDSAVINSALGFNAATTGASPGDVSIPLILTNFIFVTLPRLVTWDYSWLKEGYLQYIRYLLIVISVGFIVYLAYQIASALGGLLQGIFLRR